MSLKHRIRELEEAALYGNELGPYTRARVEAALDPVVFWCRFCRVTLEPEPSGRPMFRPFPFPMKGEDYNDFLRRLSTYRHGRLS